MFKYVRYKLELTKFPYQENKESDLNCSFRVRSVSSGEHQHSEF